MSNEVHLLGFTIIGPYIGDAQEASSFLSSIIFSASLVRPMYLLVLETLNTYLTMFSFIDVKDITTF